MADWWWDNKMNQQISERELSERDLLIELKTEVSFLREKIDDFGDKLNSNYKAMNKFNEELSTLKQQVKENTSFRKYIIVALIGMLFELLLSGYMFFFRMK